MDIPKDDAQLVALRDEVTAVRLPDVVDEPSMGIASGLLVKLRRIKKEIKAREGFFLDPLEKHIKNVRNWFKENYYAVLNQFIGSTKERMGLEGRIATYQNEVAAKERDRLAAVMREEEADRKKVAGEQLDEADTLATFGIIAPVAPLPARTVTEEDLPATLTRVAGGLVFNRTDWDFEVTDLTAVPEKYITRTVKRAEVLAALKRGEEIAGIKVIKSIGIGVRT